MHINFLLNIQLFYFCYKFLPNSFKLFFFALMWIYTVKCVDAAKRYRVKALALGFTFKKSRTQRQFLAKMINNTQNIYYQGATTDDI